MIQAEDMVEQNLTKRGFAVGPQSEEDPERLFRRNAGERVANDALEIVGKLEMVGEYLAQESFPPRTSGRRIEMSRRYTRDVVLALAVTKPSRLKVDRAVLHVERATDMVVGGFFGWRTVGRANALQRHTLRREQLDALEPYEKVKRVIDAVVRALNHAKHQIETSDEYRTP